MATISSLPYSYPQLCFISSARRKDNGKEDLNRCEDAEPLVRGLSRLPYIFTGIADGLGGYPQGYDGKSGGYIASRCVLQSAFEFFDRQSTLRFDVANSNLTRHLKNKLQKLADKIKPSPLKGSLSRHRLATTLALCLIERDPQKAKSLTVHSYWIGDSRIYFYDDLGLHQLSRDDSHGAGDAFDALYRDSPMSQFIAATMEQDWHIHYQRHQLSRSGVLVICSDGCSTPWKAPWELELALLETLMRSHHWQAWLEAFKKRIDAVRHDDATCILFPVNAGSFQCFRQQQLLKHALQPAIQAHFKLLNMGINFENRKNIWLHHYKAHYENLVPRYPQRRLANLYARVRKYGLNVFSSVKHKLLHHKNKRFLLRALAPIALLDPIGRGFLDVVRSLLRL